MQRARRCARLIARTPQYVTAVEWVDLANGEQRMRDYDASGRLKTHTVVEASRSNFVGMSLSTMEGRTPAAW
jgi:hypothetical protein